ncbi:MAG: hypothetical protein GYB65_15330 [Chloroflexi bacterium]|nr:hypothetical protein [Chloroflexota bacterium]
MKRFYFASLAVLASFTIGLAGHPNPVRSAATPPVPRWPGCTPTQHYGCTVFLATDGDTVLAGNSEDWRNPSTRMWVIPPTEEAYGRIYFGFDDFFPQGGVNDQGLFFDGLAMGETVEVNDNLPYYPGNIADLAMSECATVECVVDLFSRYSRSDLANAQLYFGDATGDAVIVEPTAFIRIDGEYLVATNFYQSQTEDGSEVCNRYWIANYMLENADAYTIELFRDILDAIHQEGAYPTQYSNIYDLKAGLIYLYYFHDFEQVVEIDVQAAFAQGPHIVDLADLFPDSSTAYNLQERRAQVMARQLAGMDYIPDVDPSGFEALAGRYLVPDALVAAGFPFDHLAVSVNDGQVYAAVPNLGMPAIPLYTRDASTFFYTSYDESLVFVLAFETDGSGSVTHAMFEIEDMEMELIKVD